MPETPVTPEATAVPRPATRRKKRSGAKQLWMALALIVFVILAATYMYSSRVDPVRPEPAAESALSVRPPEATGVPSTEQPATAGDPDRSGGAAARPDLLAGLAPEVQAKVKGIAEKQPCSCDCGMTVWVCNRDDPTCEHSPAELHAIIEAERGGSATPPTAK